ncbi:hypothetical protein, partial [Edwardsiella hoshinae]|uniref:hypothetical protein n=1 Tax=Edwardsiella hoshinae TaxID=93378 RepID=UPI000555E2E5
RPTSPQAWVQQAILAPAAGLAYLTQRPLAAHARENRSAQYYQFEWQLAVANPMNEISVHRV